MPAAHPPKPVFAFSVGVIGHRPGRLPDGAVNRVHGQMATVLAALRKAGIAAHARYRECYAPDPARFTLVTALAEGADRIGAIEAASHDFALAVPLPFPAAEYEKDFSSEASKADFRRLLEFAPAVLQFQGDRSAEEKSYEQAGLAVLDASDLLITIWDGKPAAGRGGTTEMVYEAARRGMPVIHIHTDDTPFRLYWREPGSHHFAESYFEHRFCDMPLDGLAIVVERLTCPPRPDSERPSMHRYLRQQFRRFNFFFPFPMLMGLLGVRMPRSGDLRRAPLEMAVRQVAAEAIAAAPLITAYVWADEIAVRFAQRFRGAFIANFVLAAAATTLAALQLPGPWGLLEIVPVLAMLGLTGWGHRQHWHHLWIEAREVAERLRTAMPLYAVGARVTLPFGEMPAWTSWYARAMLRQEGLRNGVLDASGLAAAKNALLAFLAGQQAYHGVTATRFQSLHERLEAIGKTFLRLAVVLTAGVFVAGRCWQKFGDFERSHPWPLVLFAVGLPAIAAASYGIRVIGDFEGAAARSGRMSAQLEQLSGRLDDDSDLETLRDVGHRAADVLLGDVSSWRLVVESRKLDVPG